MSFGFARSLTLEREGVRASVGTHSDKEVDGMATVATTAGKFVWHEQVSSEPKQGQDFYTQLFGWDTEVFMPGEVDYTMISSGGQNHGGFGKALEGAPPAHWLSHVAVEMLDETIEKAKRAGARLAAGPFEVTEVGRMAIIADPQGAYIGVYQPAGDNWAPGGRIRLG